MAIIRVCESSDFMKLFDPELNPGFDPEKVYSNSTKKVTYHKNGDGELVTRPVLVLFRRKDMLHERAASNLMAADVPGFMEIFVPELNPGLDPAKIKATDRKTRINYYGPDGRVQNAAVYSVVVTLRNHATGKYTPKRAQPDIIGDDEHFWKYCAAVDPKEKERIRYLSKTHNRRLPMICPKGHPFLQSPEIFFGKKIPCPYCSGKKMLSGVSDAAAMDPGLEPLWDEPEADIHAVPATSLKTYHFKCPLCNYKFARCLNQLIFRSPKCPACHDTGKQVRDLPGDVNLFQTPYDGRRFLSQDSEPEPFAKQDSSK